MQFENAWTLLNSVYHSDNAWITLEALMDKNGNIYPVKLHNIVFEEDKVCVLRFACGGQSIDIHITVNDDSTLDFGILCFGDTKNGWFSSTDFKECIKFLKQYFMEHKM